MPIRSAGVVRLFGSDPAADVQEHLFKQEHRSGDTKTTDPNVFCYGNFVCSFHIGWVAGGKAGYDG